MSQGTYGSGHYGRGRYGIGEKQPEPTVTQTYPSRLTDTRQTKGGRSGEDLFLRPKGR